MFQTVKIGGSFAHNADFGVPTCLVSSLWFSCGVAVSMGEAAKHSFSKISKQVVMSFCVAGVALCDIPTCLITCRKCQTWRKSRTKCSFFCIHASSLESLVFLCVVVSMGEAAKRVLLSCCQLRKLPEASYEMLVFLLPRVLSRVAGFPVASPCLWGKLENISYSNVPKQVVMSFCVAGMPLCDIPTCLITCRKYQNWRKSRTKCSCFCTHLSCLESLVFLWRRRVYGESWKTSPIRMCPSRLSCRFAWQAWHFVTFQPV